MVAIEALACGKPLVAPNVGGPKDIVNSKEIGRLFESKNVNDLCNNINEVINEFESFKPESCTSRASFFSIKNQSKSHSKLYLELLNGK